MYISFNYMYINIDTVYLANFYFKIAVTINKQYNSVGENKIVYQVFYYVNVV